MFFSCFNISFRTVRDFALSLQGIRRSTSSFTSVLHSPPSTHFLLLPFLTLSLPAECTVNGHVPHFISLCESVRQTSNFYRPHATDSMQVWTCIYFFQFLWGAATMNNKESQPLWMKIMNVPNIWPINLNAIFSFKCWWTWTWNQNKLFAYCDLLSTFTLKGLSLM